MPEKPKTPDLPCVTVSAAEKPVSDCHYMCPPHLADGLTEQRCINYLVKWCGWRCWKEGQLTRCTDMKEAA